MGKTLWDYTGIKGTNQKTKQPFPLLRPMQLLPKNQPSQAEAAPFIVNISSKTVKLQACLSQLFPFCSHIILCRMLQDGGVCTIGEVYRHLSTRKFRAELLPHCSGRLLQQPPSTDNFQHCWQGKPWMCKSYLPHPSQNKDPPWGRAMTFWRKTQQ